MKLKRSKVYKVTRRSAKLKTDADLASVNMSTDKKSTSHKIDKALLDSIETGSMIDPSDAFDSPESAFGYTSEDSDEDSPTMLAVMAREAATVGLDYQNEFIMRMLHKYRLRGLPVHTVAEAFNVSRQTIWRWHKKLDKRFTDISESIDFNPYVGETLEYFRTLSENAFRILYNPNTKDRAKLFSINTLLSIKAEERRFFEVVGFFDTNRFTGRKTTDENQQAANKLKEATKEFAALYDDTNTKNVMKDYSIKMRKIAEDTKEKAVNLGYLK